MTKLYQAKESFHTEIDGVPMTVQAGQIVEEGSPMLSGRLDMFADVVPDFPAPLKASPAKESVRVQDDPTAKASATKK